MSLGGLVEVAWCLSRNPSNYYGAPWKQEAHPQQLLQPAPPRQAPPQHLLKPAKVDTDADIAVSSPLAAGSSDDVDPLVAAVNEQRRVPREARR